MAWKPKYEPEYEEKVEHDTVLILKDGKLREISEADPRACDSQNSRPEARASASGAARVDMEVTADDPEVRE